MRKERYQLLFIAALGGLFTGFGISNGLCLLSIPGLAFLWSIRRNAETAFLWGFCAVLVSHRWLLSLHPLDWIGVPAPLSIPIAVFVWIACGVIGGALVFVWSLIGKFPNLLDLNIATERGHFFYALVMASFWGLGEVLLARTPFFWVGLSSSLVVQDKLLLALARWFGTGGLAAIELLIAWLIWRLYVVRRNKFLRKKHLIVGGITIFLVHSIGFTLLRPEVGNSSISIGLWQPAIPTREKFSEEQQELLPYSLQEALNISEKKGADFLVAPEGTLTPKKALIETPHIPLLIGGFRWEKGQQRSSLLVFDENKALPSVFLDKHRLVPLGEWVPTLSGLNLPGLSAVGGLYPGEPSRLLEWKGPNASVAICYELSNGNAIAGAVLNGAEWILAVANLDPYPVSLQREFISLAQLRSIENGRNLLSVANTGPSALFLQSGEVKNLLPPFREGIAVSNLNLNKHFTLYTRWRELPLFFSLLVGLTGVYFVKIEDNY